MPLLRPRIRKEDVDAREGSLRDHRGDDLDSVVADDAHIVEPEDADALQQAPYAGRMNVDGDEIDVAMRVRNGRGRLAHAEADFEHAGRAASEHARKIERLLCERKRVTRRELIERSLLRG